MPLTKKNITKMKIDSFSKSQLVNAITWAMVIIITSVLLQGVEQAQTVFIILVGGATTQMFHLSNLKRLFLEKEGKSCETKLPNV